MSRLTRHPIQVPSNIKAELINNTLLIKKDDKESSLPIPTKVNCKVEESKIYISGDPVLRGTIYRLTQKNIAGLIKPYQKTCILKGPGYKASMADSKIDMELGFSHKVRVDVPNNVKVKIENPTTIKIESINAQYASDFAVKIQRHRAPSQMKKGCILIDNQVVKWKKRKVS